MARFTVLAVAGEFLPDGLDGKAHRYSLNRRAGSYAQNVLGYAAKTRDVGGEITRIGFDEAGDFLRYGVVGVAAFERGHDFGLGKAAKGWKGFHYLGHLLAFIGRAPGF
jgi:hypothetical protein